MLSAPNKTPARRLQRAIYCGEVLSWRGGALVHAPLAVDLAGPRVSRDSRVFGESRENRRNTTRIRQILLASRAREETRRSASFSRVLEDSRLLNSFSQMGSRGRFSCDKIERYICDKNMTTFWDQTEVGWREVLAEGFNCWV